MVAEVREVNLSIVASEDRGASRPGPVFRARGGDASGAKIRPSGEWLTHLAREF